MAKKVYARGSLVRTPYSEPLDYLLTNNRLFEAIELIQSGRVDEKALSKALRLTSGNSFLYELEYITMLLIAANVPLNNTDGDGGMTALHGAARCGSVNTVRMLLAAGADPNFPTRGGWTILHEALLMSSGSEEKMKLIIAAGGNLFAKCETGDNPVECARKMGRTETVDFLLDQMKILGVEEFQFDAVLT